MLRTITRLAALVPFALALLCWPSNAGAGGILDVNNAKLIARADLIYKQPASRSEAGIPVGNGRMGSLVWTSPAALKLQINRVDVFGNGCNTESFPERHTDYCGGCGFVDLDFGDPAVFVSGDQALEHLSCYDGMLTLNGRGITAQRWPGTGRT